jgi:hypothetical protein
MPVGSRKTRKKRNPLPLVAAAHPQKLLTETDPPGAQELQRPAGQALGYIGGLYRGRAAIRFDGSLLIEQNDEWLVGRLYLSAEPQREEGARAPAGLSRHRLSATGEGVTPHQPT